MGRRLAPLVLVVACAFDSSGQGSGAVAEGTASEGPTPATTSSTATTPATMSDSADATTQGPTTTSPTSPTDATAGTETTDDPTTTGAVESTGDPTRSDETTTDPSQGETEVRDVEVCDGLDNDDDGGIDEGSPDNPSCDGCTFVAATAGPYYFAVCSEPFTWELARTRCADFGPGGDLAKIENADDQDALLALVAEDHWIGIEDMVSDGLWFWVDGTMARAGVMVFGYDGWAPGQPSGALAENCAEIDPAQAGWADSSCNQSQPIVCRHDA